MHTSFEAAAPSQANCIGAQTLDCSCILRPAADLHFTNLSLIRPASFPAANHNPEGGLKEVQLQYSRPEQLGHSLTVTTEVLLPELLRLPSMHQGLTGSSSVLLRLTGSSPVFQALPVPVQFYKAHRFKSSSTSLTDSNLVLQASPVPVQFYKPYWFQSSSTSLTSSNVVFTKALLVQSRINRVSSQVSSSQYQPSQHCSPASILSAIIPVPALSALQFSISPVQLGASSQVIQHV
ncbi:uncharacterized protein LOC134935383 isoform X2 [Pseudophryne corroboree]|uniref:uncharacterized protein LOC134935383 isoform X2 n=1 Tax=Pseudophryne corroboree TaxID=495146 RepID=UPI003081D9C3